MIFEKKKKAALSWSAAPSKQLQPAFASSKIKYQPNTLHWWLNNMFLLDATNLINNL